MEFLKASIADLITLLFSSLPNSEGGGDGDSGGQFLPFPKNSSYVSDLRINAKVLDRGIKSTLAWGSGQLWHRVAHGKCVGVDSVVDIR